MVTGWRTRRAEGACRADLLLAMGAHFAAAIEADHLLGDLRRRVRGLEAVHALALRIFAGAPGDPVPLLQDACAEIAGAFSARQAVVMLLEDGERSLRQVAAHGQPVPEQLRTLPLERSRLAQEALESGTPVATPDTFGDPRSAMFGVTEPAGVAMLTVPLVARGRRRGVIFVGDRAGRHFGEADLALATTLGAEVALALENADLYGESLRAHARVLATNADLRRANERNVRQERLAALGEFSAVVAHEVRNPLGVIFNSLGSIRRLLQPTGDARLLLDIIGEESDRLNRMVGDLLDFARPTPPQLQLERLERVVDDAVSAALLGPPGTIDVLRQVEPGLPPVPVDARLVRQALLNVATNALQAMPRGGRLTVRVRAEGEAVVVELEDTGGGIAEDVRARIFEPFFTTKATGTGLGLAVVRRIVEGHGGEITVETRPGVGTRFALRFPLRSDAGPADLETATDLG
jgi:signal transduction histidine kinase